MQNYYDRTQEHNLLINKFMVALNKEFPNVMVLKFTNGMFRAFDNPDRIIRAGQKGVLDLVVFGKNYWIFFDSKTGNAVFTPEQKAFKNRCLEISEKETAFKLTSVEQGLSIVREFEK